MILIIGSPEEAHAAHMYQHLQLAGQNVAYLDTQQFPHHTQISLSLANNQPLTGFFQETPHALPTPSQNIQGVFWRYFSGFSVTSNNQNEPPDAFLVDMAQRELHASMGTFFRGLDCFWMNSPEAIDLHRYKVYQLELLRQQGLPVPDTLITTDARHLKTFYDNHLARNQQVIFKPVSGGAHTEVLQENDFSADRLGELAHLPVQFQTFVPGVDIRVYVIGQAVFAAEIQTPLVDFRNDPSAPIVPITLPDDVAQQCLTLAKTLQLEYTGIDIRRTPEGQHIFLEGNPAPMFIYFERMSGYPITQTLISHLIAGSQS